jgi:hypothetical protein
MVITPPDYEVGAKVYLIAQQQPYLVVAREGNWVELQHWLDASAAPPLKVHVNNLEWHP